MFKKKIDGLGRLVIPKCLRAKLGLECGETIIIFYDEDQEGLVLKKEQKNCCICSKTHMVSMRNGVYICKQCLEKIEDKD